MVSSSPGWMIAPVPPSARRRLSSLGLRDYPTALGVIPGSVADESGLREGDWIEAAGGISWPLTDAGPDARKAFWDALYAGIQAPTMEIKAEHEGRRATSI